MFHRVVGGAGVAVLVCVLALNVQLAMSFEERSQGFTPAEAAQAPRVVMGAWHAAGAIALVLAGVIWRRLRTKTRPRVGWLWLGGTISFALSMSVALVSVGLSS